MTRAVGRATARGISPGSTAAALTQRGTTRSESHGTRDAGECWSLRLTPDERRSLGEELDALTEREREVALAICDGGSNEAIAERLYIALPTLRTHLMRINQKLGTKSKGDVVRLMVGRLLDSYRIGRITPAPGSPARPAGSLNGLATRVAEHKPSALNGLSHAGAHGESEGQAQPNHQPATRPGLARPKIIAADDDSRAEVATMAGSL